MIRTLNGGYIEEDEYLVTFDDSKLEKYEPNGDLYVVYGQYRRKTENYDIDWSGFIYLRKSGDNFTLSNIDGSAELHSDPLIIQVREPVNSNTVNLQTDTEKSYNNTNTSRISKTFSSNNQCNSEDSYIEKTETKLDNTNLSNNYDYNSDDKSRFFIFWDLTIWLLFMVIMGKTVKEVTWGTIATWFILPIAITSSILILIRKLVLDEDKRDKIYEIGKKIGIVAFVITLVVLMIIVTYREFQKI